MRRVCLLLPLLFVLLGALRLDAQEPPREPAAPVPAGGVEEAGPVTVYLKDEKGNLVPVPGFSYERYRELVLAEGRAVGTEPPAVSLEKLVLQGSIDGKIAHLEGEATLHVRSAGWTSTPLRMPGAVLRGPVSAAGDLELVHRYDAEEGHVLWLKGTVGRRYVVKLPLLVATTESSGQQRLAISLPKASETRLALDVPGKIAQATLVSGDGVLETTSEGEDSRVAFTGAAGDVAIAWRNGPQGAASTNLEASAEIDVQVETRDAITFTAALKATRSGEPIRSLLVRLPPQTELSDRPARGYKVSPASAEDLAAAEVEAAAMAARSIVRVEFDRVAESVDFSLAASYKPLPESASAPLEVAGFEVLGGARQTGHVSVFLPAGWSLRAKPDETAFRVDDAGRLPGQTRANARFRFVRQPFSLPIFVEPQPARTVVEPGFSVLVESRRVTLSGTLEYQVRGPRPEFLEVDLNDWMLDAALPESLVEIDSDQESGKPARLILQPGVGSEFAVQLQLHRPVPADALNLAFGLPRAIASQTLPATVAISTADNVAIVPQSEELRALVQEEQLPLLSLPATGQRPLVYREVASGAEPPRFVASFQLRKRHATATLQARAQIGAAGASVEQKIALDIAYEPLATLTLETPLKPSISELQVFRGDQLLNVREEALAEAPRGSPPTRRWRVELPELLIGAQTLGVHYAAALPSGDTADLPLVTPVEADGLVIARQQLAIESRSQQTYVLAETHSEDPGLQITNNDDGATLTWPRRLPLVKLHRATARSSVGPALRVEKQWLQTWLSGAVRRDRLVARVTGVQDRLRIILPPGVVAAELRALVDGAPPRELELKENVLTVRIASAVSDDPQTLEVWYLLPVNAASVWPERRLIQMPRVAGAATPEQTWVQLLTPASEQVLLSSSAMTPQMTWRRRGWLFQRAGRWTTRELEAWIGTATRPEDLGAEVNDALFMTLGPLHSVEVVLCGRRWLWVFIAGGVLAAGIGVYYLSRGRSLSLVAALGIALGLAAMISPELALNVSQFVGAGLLLLTGLIWSLRITGQQPEAESPPSLSSIRRGDSRMTRREPLSTASTPRAPSSVEMKP